MAELIEEHSRLTEQLTKLTNEFRTTLASNKRLVSIACSSPAVARPGPPPTCLEPAGLD